MLLKVSLVSECLRASQLGAEALQMLARQVDLDAILGTVADDAATLYTPVDHNPLDHRGEHSPLVSDAQVATPPRRVKVLDDRQIG